MSNGKRRAGKNQASGGRIVVVSDFKSLVPGAVNIVVSACSGNVRPWQARIYRADGTYAGATGYCNGEGRAIEAARAIAEKAARS